MSYIYVFGSNLGGNHISGAAASAVKYWGAINGQAAGMQGTSYALPIKDHSFRDLPLSAVTQHVKRFTKLAAFNWLSNNDIVFNIAPLEWSEDRNPIEDVAKLFIPALELTNVILPTQILTSIQKFKKNFNARIPLEIKREIRAKYLGGMCQAQIAREHDMSLQAVWKLLKRIA